MGGPTPRKWCISFNGSDVIERTLWMLLADRNWPNMDRRPLALMFDCGGEFEPAKMIGAPVLVAVAQS